MGDITIFEQHVRGDSNSDENFFVKLTTDERNENFIYNFKVMAVTINEQVNIGSPMIMITVMDMVGDLVNHVIIEPEFTFKLILANDNTSTNEFKLRPSKISATSTTEQRNDQILYTMYMVTDKWQDLLGIRRNRAWVDVKYSDIVHELAEEVGFKNIYVTPTKRTVPLVIQPYWTNYEMLRWIRNRCEPENKNNSGVYDFAVTMNDGFYFTSLGDIIRQKKSKVQETESSNEDRTLVMQDVTKKDYEKGYRRIGAVDVEQDFIGALSMGGSGIEHGHFNYMNKEYIKGEPAYYSDSDEPQLSDWSMVSEGLENASKRIYTHRDINSQIIAQNAVSDAVNHMQRVTVRLDGISDVNLGDVVEIQIPLSPENSASPFNEFFSGSYIVTQKKAYVRVNSTKGETMLKLSRQGVNSNNVKGLIKSARGKSL